MFYSIVSRHKWSIELYKQQLLLARMEGTSASHIPLEIALLGRKPVAQAVEE